MHIIRIITFMSYYSYHEENIYILPVTIAQEEKAAFSCSHSFKLHI